MLPELMDRPQPVSPELEKDLENLVSLNRRFGSHRLLLNFARRWLRPGRRYRVLDLATGAGDLPRALVSWARAREIDVSVDAVDFQPATLTIAAAASSSFPEINWIEGDIRTFSAVDPYDLVTCSLALHHFSEEDAVRILRNGAELSKRWMLVSDLERSAFTSVAVWLLTQFFYTEPMTRCDARMSAQRAFSFKEMKGLAESAGLTGAGHGRFLFARQALWLDRE
jgi:ubiquinone/menaquinone biosynthesis C-methylase UbiE